MVISLNLSWRQLLYQLLKNKCGNLSDSNNYRPIIAIATITSKVLESVFLVKCEEFLYTFENQFAFKSDHSTEFCIYTLQEYIEFFKRRNTKVVVTFLDASKACDRIDHWRLFTELIDKHVSLFVIKLLVFWYSLQQMNIKWSNTVSSSFHVNNGVKQCGIISAVLFNVYIDDLSISRNNSGIGGHIGEKTINRLCSADDVCLIALASSAMQQLLNICHTYSTGHSFLYNGNKSFSACFKPSTIKFTRPWFSLLA